MRFSAMTFPFHTGFGEPAEQDERYLEWTVDQAKLMAENGLGVFFTEHHFRGAWHSNPMQFAAYLVPQLPADAWLGFAVLCVPHYHPLRLVESMNLLDHMARGRVVFGIGKGFPGGEPAAHGYTSEYQEATPAYEATMDAAERLWAWNDGDEPVTFDTGYHRGTVSARVMPAPYRKPRPNMIVAASREESLRAAGAAGLPIFVVTFDGVEARNQQLALYREALAAAGHPEQVLRFCRDWCTVDWTAVVIAESLAEAEDSFERAKEERLRYRRMYTEHQTGQSLAHARADDGSSLQAPAADRPELRNPIVGTPEMITEHVGELQRAGLDHLLLRFMGEWNGDTRGVFQNSLRLFANEVMPKFT